METCFNYCSPDKAFFSSDERKWINRVRKMAAEHPEEVRIIAEPENNDGCIYCQLPIKCLKVYYPSERVLTEEQRQARAEALRVYRQNKG